MTQLNQLPWSAGGLFLRHLRQPSSTIAWKKRQKTYDIIPAKKTTLISAGNISAGNSDDLYCELKHIRNALESLQPSLAFTQQVSEQSRHIEAIAAAHRILRTQRHAASHPDPGQLALF